MLIAILNLIATELRKGASFWVLVILLIYAAYTWMAILFFRNRWREWRLLREGIVADGIVVIQQEVQRSLPRIVYVFEDRVGRKFQNRVTDFSQSLYEEMPVTIFYEENDPSRSMALESSVFKLVSAREP